MLPFRPIARRRIFEKFVSTVGYSCFVEMNEGSEIRERAEALALASTPKDREAILTSGRTPTVLDTDAAWIATLLTLVAVVGLFAMRDMKDASRAQLLMQADGPVLYRLIAPRGPTLESIGTQHGYAEALSRVTSPGSATLLDGRTPTDLCMQLFQVLDRHSGGALGECFQYNEFRMSRVAQYYGEARATAVMYQAYRWGLPTGLRQQR